MYFFYLCVSFFFFFFFFQAEDGIRDLYVTGVQTCALPICFYEALMSAERAPLHEFDQAKFFEGCLPIEVMASRGVDTLRFGPMKPVGQIGRASCRERV